MATAPASDLVLFPRLGRRSGLLRDLFGGIVLLAAALALWTAFALAAVDPAAVAPAPRSPAAVEPA